VNLLETGFGIVKGTVRQATRVGGAVIGRATGRGDGEQQQGGRRDSPGPGGGLGAQHSPRPKSGMDDNTLARKVESEVFRGTRGLKSKVDINVVHGVVELRGEVRNPDDVKKLEAQAKAVPEVRGVENFLHLPKTPSPTRSDTPARQRKTESSTKRKASTAHPRSAHKKTTAEPERIKHAEPSEPKPDELASRREGRQPAPLGAQETGEESSSSSGGEGSSTGGGSGSSGSQGAPASGSDSSSGSGSSSTSGNSGSSGKSGSASS